MRIEEKWLAQTLRKYLTEAKLERTRKKIKIMLSAPPTKSWNNPRDSSTPLNCASVLKIHTNLHLLNHLQTLHTH